MRTLILGLIVAVLSWAPPVAAQGISTTTQEFNVEAGTQYRLTWPDTRAVGVMRSDADGQLTLTGIAGTDITTGIVAPARLGTGTPDDTTFLRGDGQWQTVTQGGTGVTMLTATSPLAADSATGNVTLSISLAATDIPDLGAAKITSGTFAAARIPVLGTANVGGLAASDTTTGTFAAARIPNLPASRITSGTFPVARVAPSSTNGQVLMTVGGATAWTFPFEFPTTVSGRARVTHQNAVTDGVIVTATASLSTSGRAIRATLSNATVRRTTSAGTCSLALRDWINGEQGRTTILSNGETGPETANPVTADIRITSSVIQFPVQIVVSAFLQQGAGAVTDTCQVDAGAQLTLTEIP